MPPASNSIHSSKQQNSAKERAKAICPGAKPAAVAQETRTKIVWIPAVTGGRLGITSKQQEMELMAGTARPERWHPRASKRSRRTRGEKKTTHMNFV